MIIKAEETIKLRLKIPILCIGILLSIYSPIYSQVNIEKMRQTKLKNNHEIDLSGSFYSGNSEAIQYKIKTRSEFQLKSTQVLGIFSLQEKQSSSLKYINKGFGHFRLITPINNNLKTELFSQKEFDDFKLLKDRVLFGGGLRGYVIKNNLVMLTLGVGGMYETERILVNTLETITKTFRSTNYISANIKINHTVKFNSITYIQPKISDISNIRLLMQNELKVQLTRNLNLKTNFNISYNSSPPKSVKKSDIELFTGLSIQI